jgi:hypothetical protein
METKLILFFNFLFFHFSEKIRICNGETLFPTFQFFTKQKSKIFVFVKVISVCYPTQHEKNFSQEKNSF